MAKRTRASRSAHRPGGQGPTRAKKSSDGETSSAVPSEAEVTDAEEIGATYSEVEVDEIAASAIAAAMATPATEDPEPIPGRRSLRRARGRTSKKRGHDALAARAAAEDVWVREDLRRIAVVSLILVVGLGLAYIVFVVIDVLGLY